MKKHTALILSILVIFTSCQKAETDTLSTSEQKQSVEIVDEKTEIKPVVKTEPVIPTVGVINDTRVRLRTEPNLESETLEFLNTGDAVRVFSKTVKQQQIDTMNAHWYKVQGDEYPEGWVYGAFVDIEGDYKIVLEESAIDGVDLLEATKNGNLEEVKILIASGANINATDEDGQTPLDIARKNNHTEIIQLLDDAGAMTSYSLGEALFEAARSGNLDEVKKLIDKGADINHNHQGEYETVLMVAAGSGYIEIVKFLIENGVDVKGSDMWGETALTYASRDSNIDMINLLLQNGASVNDMGQPGTALMMASSSGHIEIVKLLIDSGANVNTDSLYNYTALIVASESGHTEIVKILLENGARASINTISEGGSALTLASSAGHTEIIKLLKEAGATE